MSQKYIYFKNLKGKYNPICQFYLMMKKVVAKDSWCVATVVVAEWLRRLTRNQMGYTRTGSNPVHDG